MSSLGGKLREASASSAQVDLRLSPLYHDAMIPGTTCILGRDDEGRRLDRVLRIILASMTLSSIHKALRKGDIRVNGARRSPDYRCVEGDIIELSRILVSAVSLENEKARLEKPPKGLGCQLPAILLETPDILFLDKPAGILVHDGATSLDAMVRQYLEGKLDPSLAFVPGPLHRLDRNTSGVIAFSRSLKGAKVFSEAMRQGSVRKTYVALLEGSLETPAVWRDSLSRDKTKRKSLVGPEADPSSATPGKEALTEAFPLVSLKGVSLAALRLGTGRTHQIRAQAAAHGHALVGDLKYGGEKNIQPYWLHAWEMAFDSALLPGIPPRISAPLPPDFLKIVQSSFSIDENEVYSLLRQFRF